MTERLAAQLTKYFRLSVKLSKEEEEIIQYGIEISISTLGVLFSILLISVIWFQKLDGIVFTFFFTSIRLYSGGFHANTYIRCYICSLIAFICTACCTKFISIGSLWVQYIVIVLFYVWIYSKAPQINKNHPISEAVAEKNRKKLKKVMVMNQVLFWIISFVSPHYRCIVFYTTIIMGIMFGIGEINLKVEKQ